VKSTDRKTLTEFQRAIYLVNSIGRLADEELGARKVAMHMRFSTFSSSDSMTRHGVNLVLSIGACELAPGAPRLQGARPLGNRGMSLLVQVFGRRHDEPFHTLWRPASKKRQGTKSREVWHWRCGGRYGDLMAAPSWRVDITPTGCGRRISPLARLEAYSRHLGKRLERIKERTARRPR
jgi:hypothetical protein